MMINVNARNKDKVRESKYAKLKNEEQEQLANVAHTSIIICGHLQSFSESVSQSVSR